MTAQERSMGKVRFLVRFGKIWKNTTPTLKFCMEYTKERPLNSEPRKTGSHNTATHLRHTLHCLTGLKGVHFTIVLQCIAQECCILIVGIYIITNVGTRNFMYEEKKQL